MENIIYGLADSRNDLIYYVGKTTVGKKRALQHLINSHSPEVNKWKEEVEAGLGYVKVILIEDVDDILLLSEREKYWIGVYKVANEKLLNKKDFPELSEYYTEEDNVKFNELKRIVVSAGDIIKKKRLSLNITQDKLAEECGLSRWCLSKLENGDDVQLRILKKLILGLDNLSKQDQIVQYQIKERAH